MNRTLWNGSWPSDQYPAKGARLRYRHTRPFADLEDAEEHESTVQYVWCGVEPVIELDNGERLYSWDEWEEQK